MPIISGRSILFILLFALPIQTAEVVWFRDDAPQRFTSDANVHELTNYPFYDPPDHHPKGYLRFPDVFKPIPILSKIPAFPLRSESQNLIKSTNNTVEIPVLDDEAKQDEQISLVDQLATILPEKVQRDSFVDIVESRNKSLYQKMAELGAFLAKNSNTTGIDQQELLHEIVETEKQPENALKQLADSLKPEFRDIGMQIVDIQKNKTITELEKQKSQAVVLDNLADSAKTAMKDFDIFLRRSTRTRRQLYNNQNQPQMWNYHPDMYRNNMAMQAQPIVAETQKPSGTNFADLLTKNKFLMPTPLECIACNSEYPPKGFFPAEPTRPPGFFNYNNMDANFGPPRPPTTQPPPVFDVDLSEKPNWNNAFNERNRLFGKYVEKPKSEYELPMPTPINWNGGISNTMNNNVGFGQGFGGNYGRLAPFTGQRISDLKITRGDPPDYSFSVDRKQETMRPSQLFAQRPEQTSQAQIIQQATAYLQKQAQIPGQTASVPVQTEILQKTTEIQNTAPETHVSISETTLSQTPQISGIPIKTSMIGLSPSMPQAASTSAIGRFDTDIGRYDDGSSRNTHRFVIPTNILKEIAPEGETTPPPPTPRPTRPSPWGSNTGMSKNYRPPYSPPAETYVIPPPPNFVPPSNENSEPVHVPTGSRILTDEDSRPPVKSPSNTIILTRDGPADVAPARDMLPPTTPKPEDTTPYQSYPDYRQGLFPVPLNQRTEDQGEQPALNPDREIPNKDNRPEDLSLDRLGPQGYYGGGSNRYKQDNGKLSESGFRKDINDQTQWPSAVDDRRRNGFYDPSVRHGPASVNIHNQPLPPYGGTSRASGNPNVYKEGDDLSQSEPTHSRLDYGPLVAKEYTTALPWYLETTTVVTVPKIDVDERLMYPAERDGETALARTREALSEANLRIPQRGQIRPYFGPEEITRSRYTNENPAGTNIRDGTGKSRFVMIDLPNTSTIS
uniref:DUF148 domain-containing protein n=1 Tax=Panagrellus redivivus TaxID=6233 RepID=A0A7E4VCD2_PANRE